MSGASHGVDEAGTRVDTSLARLFTLAWPVVVARSSQAVVGVADALMTAPLGEAPLAAVSTGAVNIHWMAILPTGIVFICQSFAAQLKAQGRYTETVRYAWYALIVSGLTLVVTAAMIPGLGSALGLLGYSADLLPLLTVYVQIRALSLGAVVGTEALGNWYGGIGNTRLHMVAGALTMVSNIFLNWVFIYGNLGAPALGTEGAAIASVVAAWLGFGLILLAFALRWGVAAESTKPVGLRLAEFKRMLKFGLPHGANWFLEYAALAFFINIVVARLGTTALAAMMVVININALSFMPAFGLTTAAAILSGKAIGLRDYASVHVVVKRTIATAAVWQCLVGLVYLAFPTVLMGWFARGDNTRAIIPFGVTLLAIAAAWQLFDAISMTLAEVLRSAGDTVWTFWARNAAAWLVFIPGATVSVVWLDGTHVAAMVWVVIYICCLAVLFGVRYASGAWRRIDLAGTQP